MDDTTAAGIRSEFANRIAQYGKKLSRTEREIAEYMLAHECEIDSCSIHMLAQSMGVGAASIIRFSKAIGYNGFSDMKFQIEQGKLVIDKNDVGITREDEANLVKQKVLNYAQNYLEKCVLSANNGVLEQVSEAVACAGKVGILGAGSADGIAHAAASMYMSMGIMAFSVSDPLVKLRTAAYFSEADVLIGLSFSGYSKSVGDALYYAKTNGSTTVLITAYKNSLLGKYADHILYTPARNRGNSLNISTTAMGQLALLQIIQAMVYQMDIPRIKEAAQFLKSNGNMQRYDIHQESISKDRICTAKNDK